MCRCLVVAALGLVLLTAVASSAAMVDENERFTIPSKTLGEDRTILVSLPASYASGERTYPVLYLTDAQWQFDHTKTTVDFLARNRLAPEMIVVGVTNADRTRDLYATRADFHRNGQVIPFPTSGNADRFLEFFEKELIPWAEAKYRTAPLRLLAGHSAGGNFALHAMRVKPALFQVIIAASPWLAWDERKELLQLVPFLESTNVKTRVLFYTCGDEGPEMKGNLDALAAALRTRKDPSLRWDSATYPNETHDSGVIKSYYDALRMTFSEWSFPRDPRTNSLQGSLEEVKAYYAQFGARLGYTQRPPEEIVNELGYQLLKAKQLDRAIEAFRYNADLYPRSTNVWDSLADALEEAGQKDEAIASCRKAIALAEANHASSVERLRKHLDRLTDAAKGEPK